MRPGVAFCALAALTALSVTACGPSNLALSPTQRPTSTATLAATTPPPPATSAAPSRSARPRPHPSARHPPPRPPPPPPAPPPPPPPPAAPTIHADHVVGHGTPASCTSQAVVTA